MDHLDPDVREHRVSRDGRPSKQHEDNNIEEENDQSDDLDHRTVVSVWKRMNQSRCSTGAHDDCVPRPAKMPEAYRSGTITEQYSVFWTHRIHSLHDLREDGTSISNRITRS